MNLINHVLQELQNNKKRPASPHGVHARPFTSRNKPHNTRSWQLIYWLLLLVIMLGIMRGYYIKFIAKLPTTPASNQKPLALKLSNHNIITAPNTPPLRQTQAQLPLPLVKLQHITLEHKHNRTILNFMLSAPVTYYIERGANQQLFITLHNASMSGNLPISLENSFIAALNTKQNKNNIISTLTLLPGTKIEGLQLIKQPQTYLHLVLANTQLTNSYISKIPVPLSLEEQALERYQEIQHLIAQHKLPSAIQKLYLFIGDFPYHLQARTTLVSLLLKEERLEKANEILMVGLAKHSDYLPFVKLKAHILLKQRDPLAAIALLERYMPAEDPEYLALLAALYQQQGSSLRAAALYNQLVTMQPQKAAWWLGLGVALESAGKKQAAQEAYHHAYSLAELSPEMSAFLANKIKNK